MSEAFFFSVFLQGWFGLSVLVFLILFFLSAPYGRHIRKGWGPEIPSIVGWIVMELPAVIVPITCCLISERTSNSFACFCLILWLIHYLHRTFVYPFRMRMSGKRIPVMIAAIAFFTNIGINYLIFRWLFTLGPLEQGSWWLTPQVVLGSFLFAIGFFINRQSDGILRSLRKPGEHGYKIPYGGMYRWVSCPNYFGEILQWAGWVCLSWNLAALAFLVWSISNLLPRALEHHKWYKNRFENYPVKRKAMIPFLL